MITDEQITKFQEIYKKQYNKDISREEAYESAQNLLGLVELLYDQYIIDKKRKLRLEKEPKGFHLEGQGYTCHICGNSTSDEDTWYDKYGIKCMTCQRAIDKKIIPASVAKNEDSWYSKYDLESRFNIDRYAMSRFIKAGILKPRIIRNENGSPHAYLFLIKDNKDVLPPKKLTESQLVVETKDDKEWHRHEPWYKFVDPYEHLKGYKIMDYLHSGKKEAN
ncbi:MAG: hypothetical protein PHH83_02160 [Patescibacteria group bacterium]|nr:hypothetical protein [Patescibacteria group bacterium]